MSESNLAPMGQELPPLPEADEYSATRMLPNGELAPRFNGTTLRQYARSAIAADRAARAQQQAQSVGDDPAFRCLLAWHHDINNFTPGESATRIIAYIDAWGRARRTAEAPADLVEIGNRMATTLEVLACALKNEGTAVGVRLTVAEWRAAAPSPQHGKEGA